MGLKWPVEGAGFGVKSPSFGVDFGVKTLRVWLDFLGRVWGEKAQFKGWDFWGGNAQFGGGFGVEMPSFGNGF